MKAVILAGGLGTRFREETVSRPKPMVEIGGQPILWHIMKSYSAHGITDFIICCGYKGHIIREYFQNYFVHNSDVTFKLNENKTIVHDRRAENWTVTLVDTGDTTMTGGRLKRVAKYLEGETDFCLTYGDGLGNVNIKESIKFHREHNKKATITATIPPARFGALIIQDRFVKNFEEKPKGDGGKINGGFFVLKRCVIDLIESDDTIWEDLPLKTLAAQRELMAFEHDGFWHPMDTLRDKVLLEKMWLNNKAPWNIW